MQIEFDLAHPLRSIVPIAALFAKGVDDIDSGFGNDALRLTAPVTEALAPEQIGGGTTIRHEDALADQLSSVGNRIGFDQLLWLLPATSLILERSFLSAPAAYSTPEPSPHRAGSNRPITRFPPEPVSAAFGTRPASFRRRRMRFTTLRATGISNGIRRSFRLRGGARRHALLRPRRQPVRCLTIPRIAKSRLLGARWLATYPPRLQRLPTMKPGEILVTTNEI